MFLNQIEPAIAEMKTEISEAFKPLFTSQNPDPSSAHSLLFFPDENCKSTPIATKYYST